MTTWERHQRGKSVWATAECPTCKNGCTIDIGEILAKVSELIIANKWPPDDKLWDRITFNHCGKREQVPREIITGDKPVVTIVEKPLVSGKVQYI
jgi:hypothetical protein